ncbi:replication-relaxation family protein [Streptomyces sp. NPDC055099]
MNSNPKPQRSLSSHRPQRPSDRAAATGEFIARLASRLTARDRWLAGMLYEHQVFTSAQITEMAWPSPRAANLRLLQLYKWRVLDRFQPFLTYGSAPMHYVLDTAGAAVVAHEADLTTAELGYHRERALGIANSQGLTHIVGTNSLFTALIAHARRPGTHARLGDWWSEPRCRRLFGDTVRPDAYARWHEQGRTFEWFLEYDRGTERPPVRVAAKLTGYARLAEQTGIITPVLIWTPTAHRETRVRRALADAHATVSNPHHVPIATTHEEGSSDAVAVRSDLAEARWLPLDRFGTATTQRRRLIDLTTAWPDLPRIAEPAEEPHASTWRDHRPPPPTPDPPAPDAAFDKR